MVATFGNSGKMVEIRFMKRISASVVR